MRRAHSAGSEAAGPIGGVRQPPCARDWGCVCLGAGPRLVLDLPSPPGSRQIRSPASLTEQPAAPPTNNGQRAASFTPQSPQAKAKKMAEETKVRSCLMGGWMGSVVAQSKMHELTQVDLPSRISNPTQRTPTGQGREGEEGGGGQGPQARGGDQGQGREGQEGRRGACVFGVACLVGLWVGSKSTSMVVCLNNGPTHVHTQAKAKKLADEAKAKAEKAKADAKVRRVFCGWMSLMDPINSSSSFRPTNQPKRRRPPTRPRRSWPSSRPRVRDPNPAFGFSPLKRLWSHTTSITDPPPQHKKQSAQGAADKAEKAMDEGVSKAKGLFGSLKNALK